MRCPMTHDKLLKYINDYVTFVELNDMPATAKVIKSLRAVVELHRPEKQDHKQYEKCWNCNLVYPCPTIQAITRNLNS